MILTIFLTAAMAATSIPAADQIVASARCGTITRSELEQWQSYRREQRRASGDRMEELRSLVLLKALGDEARRSGLDETPALAAQRQKLHRDVAVAELKRDVRKTSQPAEETVRAYYTAHPDEFHISRRWRLQNIFKRFPEAVRDDDRERLRAEMELIRRRIEAGDDFAAMARSASDSQSSGRGGWLGLVRLLDLAEEFRDPVSRLAPGGLSEVIETADGLTLLRCTERFDAQDISYDSARLGIRKRLHRAAFDAAWEELGARCLAAGAAIEGEKDAVSSADRAADRAARVTDPTDALVAEARTRGLLDTPEFLRRRRFKEMELVAEAVLAEEVDAHVAAPTEDELKAFFDENRQAFRKPERRRARALRVPLDGKQPRELYSSLARARQEIVGGSASLESAARGLQRSGVPSDLVDLGWMSRRRLRAAAPELEDVVFSLALGEPSEPVKQDMTLNLLVVDAEEAASPASFEEARDAVATKIAGDRSLTQRRAFEASVLEAQQLRLAGE